ncbi:hypothetical protein VC83_06610 [Pseudogymnoascus destructans]|nr:uncharacterized protein VC83_09351 [Pseudogymnoascus destructans]XP_024323589.1 uncharacterized protein VC83_06610 [Pseudogymnoascus destructans]OAF54303.1 hypothetical protein VC83_09351 [Pseudogymnoascus destructans]OAF58304.1 hypothetical protein VC83_06610 [Pseudogymnoascus destructans]
MAIEAKKTATADVQHVMAEFPVRRQIVWRKNRETDLSKHGSYGIAVEVQARGNDNATPCNSCARGAGPFETGCVSFSSGYGPGNKVPFGGACANCFWGGQGGRCTLRVGGARTRVRSGSLYQDKARTNTHLGSGFDLNTTDGVRDALAELRGMERALSARGRALEGGATVEDVLSEDDVESEGEGEGSTWEGFE